MSKSSKQAKRPVTVAEAEAILERARRRERAKTRDMASAHRAPAGRRVDLANLDTPDVSHADQWAEFLNRPGRFYVAEIEIPLDDEPYGLKRVVPTTLKADDDQLIYLVEVLRQVRGALGAHARISLSQAEPSPEEQQQAAQALADARPRVRVNGVEHIGMRREVRENPPPTLGHAEGDDLIERSSLGTSAAKAARERVSIEEADRIVRRADELAAVREQSTRWSGVQPPDRDLTREEIADMLPGQRRADLAAELGRTPESIGGSVQSDQMPEDLAADLGVPVESLRRVPMQGGGYAWVVVPTPPAERGRHAAPEED